MSSDERKDQHYRGLQPLAGERVPGITEDGAGDSASEPRHYSGLASSDSRMPSASSVPQPKRQTFTDRNQDPYPSDDLLSAISSGECHTVDHKNSTIIGLPAMYDQDPSSEIADRDNCTMIGIPAMSDQDPSSEIPESDPDECPQALLSCKGADYGAVLDFVLGRD